MGSEVARLDLLQQAFTLWPIQTEEPNSRTNSTYRMAEDARGGVILSSTTALWYYESLGGTPHPILLEGQKAVAVDFFTGPDSTVWSVINGGLWSWDASKRKFLNLKTPPLPGNLLNVIVDHNDPQLLCLGTQNGISRFDRHAGELRSYTQFSPPPFDQFVQRLVDDGRGALWLDLPNF
jgi:hypothetical protein